MSKMGVAKGLINKVVKHASAEEIISNGISGTLMPWRITNKAGFALTAGAMVAGVGPSAMQSRQSALLGETSMADNLDRLISHDGIGFAQKVKQVSQGDPEIMKEIIDDSFDGYQSMADGRLVFALHNNREG